MEETLLLIKSVAARKMLEGASPRQRHVDLVAQIRDTIEGWIDNEELPYAIQALATELAESHLIQFPIPQIADEPSDEIGEQYDIIVQAFSEFTYENHRLFRDLENEPVYEPSPAMPMFA